MLFTLILFTLILFTLINVTTISRSQFPGRLATNQASLQGQFGDRESLSDFPDSS